MQSTICQKVINEINKRLDEKEGDYLDELSRDQEEGHSKQGQASLLNAFLPWLGSLFHTGRAFGVQHDTERVYRQYISFCLLLVISLRKAKIRDIKLFFL